MRLRYDGVVAVTFLIENVGTLEPGDEFTVSDEVAPAFLSRGDIHQVKITARKRVKEAEPEPAPEPTPEPAATEEPAAESEPTL